MNPFAFALRRLRRGWRAGDLLTLNLALVIAVAAAAAVGLFTDRVDRAMQQARGEAIGADLLVRAGRPLPHAFTAQAHRRGLETAHTVTFASAALVGQNTALVAVKAVDDTYPLRGTLLTASDPGARATAAAGVPAPGSAWVDLRLLAALDLELGDALSLGRERFRITRLIRYEPDRAGGFTGFAPRVMINLDTLPATGLIQPGSRATYTLMIAGPPDAIAAYRRTIEPGPGSGQSIVTPEDARAGLRTALERARTFLHLAALCAVVLASVAIGLCAHQFARRRQDEVALLKTLGADQRFVVLATLAQLALQGLAAGLVGCAIGYLAQFGLAFLLADLFQAPLPAPGLVPLVTALATGLVVVVGFALLPVIALRRVPPARVFQRARAVATPSQALGYPVALLTVASLILWQTGDAELTALVLGGAGATLVALAAAAWLLVLALGRLRRRTGAAWRFGIANIARRRGQSVVQVLAFGIGLMVLLVLGVVRADLLTAWQASIPARAPNHFLVNIQPDQRQEMADFLADQGLDPPVIYPIVRSRLIAIEGKPVDAGDYTDPEAQRLAEHEFNISWTRTLPGDNRVVAGRWWGGRADGEALASVEQSLAEALNIDIGDRLTFRVGARTVSLQAASVRDVDWDSFRANFYVLAPPGVLSDVPVSYISAIYIPPERYAITAELVRRFPAVTVLDVQAILDQIRTLIDRVTGAVEYVFGFTLAAGLVVLLAAVQATRAERRVEAALLRVLGARRRTILQALLAEFAGLGALAGILAAGAAQVIAWLVADRLLHVAYGPQPGLWLTGALIGAVGVGLAGVLATRDVLNAPPATALR